jgi:biopolymer transport protein ExbD
MASIEGGDEGHHKKGPGVKKAKKLSTRVDMTPMVDLGFLLITFFIFTTTMSSPTSMNLSMPKDAKDEDQIKAKASGALTIMLGKNNVVYYYEGELLPDGSNFLTTTFKGIRDIIVKKKTDVIKAHQHTESCTEIQQKAKAGRPDVSPPIPPDPNWQNACRDKDLVVVIKPDDEATYENTVNILDEMAIADVKRYAMVDLFPVEKDLIKATEARGGK